MGSTTRRPDPEVIAAQECLLSYQNRSVATVTPEPMLGSSPLTESTSSSTLSTTTSSTETQPKASQLSSSDLPLVTRASLCGLLSSEPNDSTKTRPSAAAADDEQQQHLTELTSCTAVHEFIGCHPAVMVVFSARRCGPCSRSRPQLLELAAKYDMEETNGRARRVRVGLVYEDVLGEDIHSFSIRAFPTYVIYRKGIEKGRVKSADMRAVHTMIEAILSVDDSHLAHLQATILASASSSMETQCQKKDHQSTLTSTKMKTDDPPECTSSTSSAGTGCKVTPSEALKAAMLAASTLAVESDAEATNDQPMSTTDRSKNNGWPDYTASSTDCSINAPKLQQTVQPVGTFKKELKKNCIASLRQVSCEVSGTVLRSSHDCHRQPTCEQTSPGSSAPDCRIFQTTCIPKTSILAGQSMPGRDFVQKPTESRMKTPHPSSKQNKSATEQPSSCHKTNTARDLPGIHTRHADHNPDRTHANRTAAMNRNPILPATTLSRLLEDTKGTKCMDKKNPIEQAKQSTTNTTSIKAHLAQVCVSLKAEEKKHQQKGPQLDDKYKQAGKTSSSPLMSTKHAQVSSQPSLLQGKSASFRSGLQFREISRELPVSLGRPNRDSDDRKAKLKAPKSKNTQAAGKSHSSGEGETKVAFSKPHFPNGATSLRNAPSITQNGDAIKQASQMKAPGKRNCQTDAFLQSRTNGVGVVSTLAKTRLMSADVDGIGKIKPAKSPNCQSEEQICSPGHANDGLARAIGSQQMEMAREHSHSPKPASLLSKKRGPDSMSESDEKPAKKAKSNPEAGDVDGFVFVRQGRVDHLARLVPNPPPCTRSANGNEYVYIQWYTTMGFEWVAASAVRELPSKRSRRKVPRIPYASTQGSAPTKRSHRKALGPRPLQLNEFLKMLKKVETTLDSSVEDLENGNMVRSANTKLEQEDSCEQFSAQYGRILPSATNTLLRNILQVQQDDVLVDVGHGIGMILMQGAYTIGCECHGVELVEDRNRIADLLRSGFEEQLACSRRATQVGKLDLRQGAFQDPQFTSFLTNPGRTTKALVNNFMDVFGVRSIKSHAPYSLDCYAAALFAQMQPGSIMVTLQKLDLPGTRSHVDSERRKHRDLFQHQNKNSSFYEMEELELGEARHTVSWSQGGGCKHVIPVYRYTRLEQEEPGHHAVFQCCNPDCPRALSGEAIPAIKEVNVQGHQRFVINHCDCGVTQKPTRLRKKPKKLGNFTEYEWDYIQF